ncbi:MULTISPECIES: hypothetical protein [unclassified Brachybacterium]|uniref:hypothetical protein n=1 Tax=unclassified Brachybacterium TaxID=2623841 RepID=UPI003F8EBB22
MSAVSSAPGEEFLLLPLDVEHGAWKLSDPVEPPLVRIVVRGAGGEVVAPLDPTQVPGSCLVRVVADPAPEDAVLEVIQWGKARRLSLIDGFSVLALSARDLPMNRSFGWAGDGEQLLRLEIDAFHWFSRREGGAERLQRGMRVVLGPRTQHPAPSARSAQRSGRESSSHPV